MSYYGKNSCIVYKKLSRETEKELFLKIRAGGSLGDTARTELIENFLPACLSAVRSIAGSMEDDDLVSMANTGLMRAVETYDSSRRACFLTYAMFFIRGRIYQHLKKEKKYFAPLDSEEVSEHHHLSENRGQHKVSAQADSHDMPQVTAWHVISLPEDAENIDFDMHAQLRDALGDASNILKRQQKTVLQAFYFGQKNFSEIARDMDISRERVRQIHKSALKKLRQRIKL